MQAPSTSALSDWVTIGVSIGGALTVSIAAWYSLKGKVAMNEQRLDQAEKDILRHDKFDNKLSGINLRTRLTLQRVEHIEEMLSGKRIDRRKTGEEDEQDSDG